MFKVSPASLQTCIDALNCVLEDRVQYSMVHIPNVFCDGHLLLINCVGIVRIHWVFHHTPEKKIRQRKIWRSWRPNGFRNDFVHKHIVQDCHRHMRCMSCSVILLKVGLVNFIFFQFHNEGIHNSVTVPLGVECLREKNGWDYAPTWQSNPTPIFSSCSGDLWNAWGLFAHQTLEFWLLMYPTNGSMPRLLIMWCPKCPLLHSQGSLKTTCSTLPT